MVSGPPLIDFSPLWKASLQLNCSCVSHRNVEGNRGRIRVGQGTLWEQVNIIRYNQPKIALSVISDLFVTYNLSSIRARTNKFSLTVPVPRGCDTVKIWCSSGLWYYRQHSLECKDVLQWQYSYTGWHKVREPGSSIAKDLIDSEDPKHTLFCRETAFVAIYALFKG